MKKISNELNDSIKKFTGSLVVFGSLEEKVLNSIEKNKNITVCDIITEYRFSFKKSEQGKKNKKAKKFNIKKLKKLYKKKTVDYLFVNLDEFDKYKKLIIPNSIYISKKEILIYSQDSEYDFDIIEKRYKRYTKNVDIINCDEGKIIRVHSSGTKNNVFKDKFYFVVDTLYNVAEVISNFMVN